KNDVHFENKDTIYSLLQSASEQLLLVRGTVEDYLSNLSPKLIGPLSEWYKYQTTIDKAAVILANGEDQFGVALNNLFQHLHERAEWFSERDFPLKSLDAWLALCDECMAYSIELGRFGRNKWEVLFLNYSV